MRKRIFGIAGDPRQGKVEGRVMEKKNSEKGQRMRSLGGNDVVKEKALGGRQDNRERVDWERRKRE